MISVYLNLYDFVLIDYVESWLVVCIKCGKTWISKKYLGCVGRGVLRFLDLRYRQPRSNFGVF